MCLMSCGFYALQCSLVSVRVCSYVALSECVCVCGLRAVVSTLCMKSRVGCVCDGVCARFIGCVCVCVFYELTFPRSAM